MTFADCARALELKRLVEQYQAALQYNEGTNYVRTERLRTGRGEETVYLTIPYTQIKQMLQDKIDGYIADLKELGITYEMS
jgi:hypothetical protein